MSEPPVAQARRALLIAFHFPPFVGSSGSLRTLGFVRYLPEFGWNPSVLTATANAYENTSVDTRNLVPEGTRVRRAFALDVRRHLSLGGRYISAMAIPDRWVSWVPAAALRGVAAVLRDGTNVVWSTYPLASAHIIGCTVARVTGRPWVADFRDPMVEMNERTGVWAPPNPAVRRARLAIEGLCVRHAARMVFCTEGARDIFVERHGSTIADRCSIVENGYDEQSFIEAAKLPANPQPRDQPLTVLHSGVIYPTPDRDPSHLFEALCNLKKAGHIGSGDIRFVLRATGNDSAIQERIDRYDVADLVQIAQPLPYLEALREMMDVGALLVLQGYSSDPAVPAKIYEYIRADRPILALVSPTGETARLVRKVRRGAIADIERVSEIEGAVLSLLAQWRSGTAVTSAVNGSEFSRRFGAQKLSALLDALVERREAGRAG